MRYLYLAALVCAACNINGEPSTSSLAVRTDAIKCHVNDDPQALLARCVDKAGAICYVGLPGGDLQCFALALPQAASTSPPDKAK